MQDNNQKEENLIASNSDEKQIEEKEDKTEKKPMSIKQIIIWILIGIMLTAITLIIIFNMSDFNETIKQVSTVDGVNMGWAVLCLVLYLALWPLSLCLVARSSGSKVSFIDSYLIGGTEHFFNGITPFSTGGQPLQVYLYTKRGVKASKSTGIIAANFVAFLIATNIFAVISLFFYGTFSKNFTAGTSWMIILGFVMNLFTLAFIILISTCKFIKVWIIKIIEFICKWRLVGKYLEKAIPALEAYCDNAQAAAKEIFSHPLTFIGAILLRVIALVPYYALPYFILKALYVDLSYEVIPLIILASSFAITTMVWVPTPGGTGGIEFAFTTIFTIAEFGAITTATGVTGMVLWRFLTYYLLMILSFIMYVTYSIISKRKQKEVIE